MLRRLAWHSRMCVQPQWGGEREVVDCTPDRTCTAVSSPRVSGDIWNAERWRPIIFWSYRSRMKDRECRRIPSVRGSNSVRRGTVQYAVGCSVSVVAPLFVAYLPAWCPPSDGCVVLRAVSQCSVLADCRGAALFIGERDSAAGCRPGCISGFVVQQGHSYPSAGSPYFVV